MTTQIEDLIARQLQERKERLEGAVSKSNRPDEIGRLIRDIDRALDKISNGEYGLCETCHDSIETETLAADPLARYCIEHLSAAERHALERDLSLARQIQTGLLPRKNIPLPGWLSAYHYEPYGEVSGDYLDIIFPDNDLESFLFVIGDVSGKGIAASMLMSQLHATFRTLAGIGLSIDLLTERANRIFCGASLSTHFATLVSGIAHRDGEVRVVNAGHCPPIVLRSTGTEVIASSGLPLGITCDGIYKTESFRLEKGESLILYTDGLSEATGISGGMYGEDRLRKVLSGHAGDPPDALTFACLKDLDLFAGSGRRADDLTLLALRRG